MQPLASSGTFITFVTSGLAGAFGAIVAVALNAPGPLVGIVGAGCGLLFFAFSVILGLGQYQRIRRRAVLFPGPGQNPQMRGR
jgi:hypothetical protein